MFKSFAAAVLPITVLALGDNSGVDAANATTLELMNVTQTPSDPFETFKMKLNYYTTYDASNSVYQFNGDLVMEIQTGLDAFDVGFCIGTDTDRPNAFDCYTHKFEIGAPLNAACNVKDAAKDQGVNSDYYMDFGVAATTDPAQNWVGKIDASTGRCINSSTSAGNAWTDITSGFYRNFQTNSPPGDDVSFFANDQGGSEHKIFGYIQAYQDNTFATKEGALVTSTPVNFKPLSTQYFCNREGLSCANNTAGGYTTQTGNAIGFVNLVDVVNNT